MELIPGQTCGGHGYVVGPPSFSPDGRRFAAGDLAGGLIVREREGPEPEAPFRTTSAIRVPPASQYSRPQARAVAWSPCGEVIAVHEYGCLRVRRAQDLSEIGSTRAGPGTIAIGGGGAWLAAMSEGAIIVLEFPSLEVRRWHHVSSRGGEYFRLETLAADPDGPLLAAGDSGGTDETATGVTLRSTPPRVTLIDAGRNEVLGEVEDGSHVRQLVFDPWRGRLLTVTYDDVGMWLPNGGPAGRWRPYPDTHAAALAVTERWILSSSNTAGTARFGKAVMDLWDAETLEHTTSTPVPGGHPPGWIIPSPDGRTLLTPVPAAAGDYGVQVWSVRACGGFGWVP